MTEKMLSKALMLTLIPAIDLFLVTEDWRIHLVAPQKHVTGICIASSNVASNIILASAIMTVKSIIATISTTTKESWKLNQSSLISWLTHLPFSD